MKNISSPLISIITVTYNCQDTLEETILSVINQTYSNIEYIIIDGGSTDRTVDIIKKYQDKISYWVSEPDKGIYDAMNKGIDEVTGDWVLFMGSDDVFYGSASLDIVHTFTDNNLYYGDVILKSQNQRYPGKITSAYKLCLINFCHQAVFYPKPIYKKYKYDINYKLWADYVLNLFLFSKFSNRFVYIDSIITLFNDKGLGSLNEDELFIKKRISIIKELFGMRLALLMRFRYKLTNIKHGFQRLYNRRTFR